MTARPEVKKWYLSTALLHIAITGLYICVGYCTLTLVVLLWGDFNRRMRIKYHRTLSCTARPEVEKATHQIAYDVTKSHDLSPTDSQVPGSDCPDSRKWPGNRKSTMNPSPVHRKWPRERKLRNGTYCALLLNAIIGLYICVGCCTLRLVVMLWDDFQQRMRVE